jgi:glycosyltransferase A (GT-A) superfamily protein (DUF2064 family)
MVKAAMWCLALTPAVVGAAERGGWRLGLSVMGLVGGLAVVGMT